MQQKQSIQAAMRTKLQRQADAIYQDRIRQVVPSTWEALGVHTRQIQLTTKSLIRQFPAASLDDVLALMDEGFQEQMREEALCAIYWLSTKRKEFDNWLWPLVDRWVEVIDDWEICDALAANIAVFIVQKNLHLIDQLVNWASFPNKWRRRFALAIAAALNQHGRTQIGRAHV